MAELRDRFWENLSLRELNRAEWEALCDGCALCCLVKLEDEDTGRIYFTDMVCALLDPDACRCTDYDNRLQKMPDCRSITLAALDEIEWLPPSCAYRLRREGRPLPDWHPLICGDPGRVHDMRRSVRGWTISEADVPEKDYETRLLEQPFWTK